MQGTARFCAHAPGVWHYQEQGLAVWRHSAQKIPVHRAYAYVRQQGTIAVYFWDAALQQPAALLHTLAFVPGAVLTATGRHRCGNDTYTARYCFVDDGCFRLTYEVRGPRKHDDIQTLFQR